MDAIRSRSRSFEKADLVHDRTGRILTAAPAFESAARTSTVRHELWIQFDQAPETDETCNPRRLLTLSAIASALPI